MSKKGHRSGGKFSRSHTTVIPVAEPVVDTLAKLPGVSRISLGLIQNVPGGERRFKVTPCQGGFKLVLRSSGSIQEIYVYTTQDEETIRAAVAVHFR